MKPALVLGVLLVAVTPAAAAVRAGAPAGGDEWRVLHRPLNLPQLERGAPCPVSRVDRRVDWSRTGVAEGVGPGPVYPILGSRSTLAVFARDDWGSWRGTKVLWFVHQRYRGNVLIRGRRVDSWERLRFDNGAVPSEEIRIAAGPSPARWRDQPAGSRGRPSYVRVRAGGCYAAQIDGTTFSRTVVFRVRFGR
jgi:hypothetical protein